MRAAEAFWLGKDEAFSYAVDKLCPRQLDTSEAWKNLTVKTGSNRDGVAWRASSLAKLEPWNVHYGIWKGAKQVELVSEEATARGATALQELRASLDAFRSTVKNDLSSIKAASDRVQTEVRSMREQYMAAQSLLTSPGFEHAIANAERMATALEAISKLSETKLSVAVFGGGKGP